MVHDLLVGQTVKFAVAGVREFRSFTGLGMGPYDGCAVIAFAKPIANQWQSLTADVTREEWLGNPIFAFSAERAGSVRARPELVHLFVTQLTSDILVTATDRDSLHLLLDRRARAEAGRAMPRSLPEWKEVIRDAPVWAIRHFRHEDGSVLSPGPVSDIEGPEAVGLVYSAQPIGPEQRVVYLSRSQNINEVARHGWEWEEEGLKPKVRRRSKGVAEVTVPTPSTHDTGLFFLLLLSGLGYELAI